MASARNEAAGDFQAPELEKTINHTILFNKYKKKENGHKTNSKSGSKPLDSWLWDEDHVHMPCSAQSTLETRPRWTKILEELEKLEKNPRSLSEVILSYNRKFASAWSFHALNAFRDQNNEMFNTTVPEIARLARELPDVITESIPLLRQGTERSVSLTQRQIAAILANAFLCTFPWRNDTRRSKEYKNFPSINFYRLFRDAKQSNVEKIKCLFHYFSRVARNPPVGCLTYTRRHIANSGLPSWATSTCHLPALHITSEGSIETDGKGMLQVDFANKSVGGGIIGNGSVQEEIRFATFPELIAARLFMEDLLDNEAMVVVGSERYSSHSGYRSTFKWTGDFRDSTACDSDGRKRCAVVAIDAQQFHDSDSQYTRESIDRELNKAFVGFSYPNTECRFQVASGNWGCGVFKGDPALKLLVQLLAAGEAGKSLRYFTMADTRIPVIMATLFHKLLKDKHLTVGQIYILLQNYGKKENYVGTGIGGLYSFLEESILHLPSGNVSPSSGEGIENSPDPDPNDREIVGTGDQESTRIIPDPEIHIDQNVIVEELILNRETSEDNKNMIHNKLDSEIAEDPPVPLIPTGCDNDHKTIDSGATQKPDDISFVAPKEEVLMQTRFDERNVCSTRTSCNPSPNLEIQTEAASDLHLNSQSNQQIESKDEKENEYKADIAAISPSKTVPTNESRERLALPKMQDNTNTLSLTKEQGVEDMSNKLISSHTVNLQDKKQIDSTNGRVVQKEEPKKPREQEPEEVTNKIISNDTVTSQNHNQIDAINCREAQKDEHTSPSTPQEQIIPKQKDSDTKDKELAFIPSKAEEKSGQYMAVPNDAPGSNKSIREKPAGIEPNIKSGSSVKVAISTSASRIAPSPITNGAPTPPPRAKRTGTRSDNEQSQAIETASTPDSELSKKPSQKTNKTPPQSQRASSTGTRPDNEQSQAIETASTPDSEPPKKPSQTKRSKAPSPPPTRAVSNDTPVHPTGPSHDQSSSSHTKRDRGGQTDAAETTEGGKNNVDTKHEKSRPEGPSAESPINITVSPSGNQSLSTTLPPLKDNPFKKQDARLNTKPQPEKKGLWNMLWSKMLNESS